MSGIAEVLLNLGFKVTGSDLRETETTERLASLGAEISYGHKEDNVTQVDVVVVSSAVKSDNPEVKAAKSRFIPVIPRAEMLAELMRMKYSIAVAGAHGKTTTTSLVASILDAAGFDPTCVIGGRLNSLGTSAQLGGSEYLVAEADESDGSFLLLFPTLAVATNIDLEHLDFYKDIEEIKDAFVRFLNKVPFFGLVILCIDNPGLQSVIPLLKRRYITYGLSKQADLRAEVVKQEGFTTSFRVTYKGSELGEAVLATPGIHNVVNALAAIGVAIELDIPFSTVQEALRRFAGIHRRLELKWQNDWTLVDDYGHHPTEIKATLAAIRDIWKGRVVAAFQPHRYTRTKALLDEFVTSFNEADVLIVTDIYAASEEKIEGITGSVLAERISKSGHKNVLFAPTKDDVAETILRMVAPGDLVITLGAGDLYKIGERLIAEWSGKESGARS